MKGSHRRAKIKLKMKSQNPTVLGRGDVRSYLCSWKSFNSVLFFSEATSTMKSEALGDLLRPVAERGARPHIHLSSPRTSKASCWKAWCAVGGADPPAAVGWLNHFVCVTVPFLVSTAGPRAPVLCVKAPDENHQDSYVAEPSVPLTSTGPKVWLRGWSHLRYSLLRAVEIGETGPRCVGIAWLPELSRGGGIPTQAL